MATRANVKFGEDLRRIADRSSEDLRDLSSLFTLDIFRGVIMDTRYHTGLLRGNWQATVGTPAVGVIDTLDPLGVETVRKAAATIEPMATNYLTNNLPYAEVWEERDGMVDRSVARVQQALRAAAGKVGAGK